MFRVRYEADRQAKDFAKFATDAEASAFAARKIASTNGPLILRIYAKGRIVYEFERPR